MKARALLLCWFLPLALMASDYTLDVRVAYFRPESKAFKNMFSGSWIDYQVEASKSFCNNVEVWANVSWIQKRKNFHTGYSSRSCDYDSGYSTYYNDDSYGSDSSYYSDYSYCNDYSYYSDYSYCNDYSYYSDYSYCNDYSSYSDYSCGSYSSSSSSCCERDYLRAWILPLSLGASYLYCLNPCLHVYAGAGATYTFFRLDRHTPYFSHHLNKSGIGALFKVGARYDANEYLFYDVFVNYLYQRLSFSHSERMWGIDKSNVNIGGLKIGAGIGVYF
jgi:hypothetical protein